MRTTIILLLFIIKASAIGQTVKSEIITIEQSRLNNIRDIHQLIPNLLTGCRIIRFDLIFPSKGGTAVLGYEDEKADTLLSNNAWRKNIAEVPLNSYIQLKVKRTDCKSLVGKIYKFKVVKNE